MTFRRDGDVREGGGVWCGWWMDVVSITASELCGLVSSSSLSCSCSFCKEKDIVHCKVIYMYFLKPLCTYMYMYVQYNSVVDIIHTGLENADSLAVYSRAVVSCSSTCM